jgi:endonuclease/exonuclease/phosphatase (EEP) superfamily protein YafD
MLVVVQNLQKHAHLGSDVVMEYQPDIALVQEVRLPTEEPGLFDAASNVGCYTGWGTAIYSRESLSRVRRIDSPHSEFGGLFRKRTTLAYSQGIDWVSFHGYNGQPFKNLEYLLDHVRLVHESVANGPAVFAGDFNTWTDEHVQAVKHELERSGFELGGSWPYAGRQGPLDHIFVRDCKMANLSTFENSSDHLGAVITLQKLA